MHHLLLILLLLLALGLFFLLPWQVATLLFVPIVAVSLVAYRKVLRATRRPTVVGRRAMIGDHATVLTANEGGAEVDYQGEIWRAVSRGPLEPGQRVTIEAVDGLTLWVAPLPRSSIH